MDWNSLTTIKVKSEIADLIKSGVITEALRNVQNENTLIFLKQVLNPLIFKDPNSVDGIENGFNQNCPHSIRLWVGYLWLEIRMRWPEANASVQMQDICNIVHSKFTFSGDTNHHLLFLYIKLDDMHFRPATTSLLLQRMLTSFEIGPLDSFQLILSWLLVKVRNVSRIRDFTTDLVLQMAVLSLEWVKNSPDAMELLISNYKFVLNADQSRVRLLTKLMSSCRECPTSCLFALLDKCISEKGLWSCLSYVFAAFKISPFNILDLPSKFEVNYPFLLLSCAQNIILAGGVNVEEEEKFVINLILTFDFLKSSHLLLKIPAMRESMEAVMLKLSHRADLAIACGWIYNRNCPTEIIEVKPIDQQLLCDAGLLKMTYLNLDRLHTSLATFAVKERSIIMYWEACTSTLAILAMSPLSCTINKVLQLILETITYCFSIVIKVTHGKKAGNRENDTNEGMYLDRQKQFLLTLLSMVEKKYNAVNFRTLLNDPMAKLPEYEPPKLHEIMG